MLLTPCVAFTVERYSPFHVSARSMLPIPCASVKSFRELPAFRMMTLKDRAFGSNRSKPDETQYVQGEVL